MIVTPREVDALVERMAGVLADGINQALHPRLSRDEIAQMMAQWEESHEKENEMGGADDLVFAAGAGKG